MKEFNLNSTQILALKKSLLSGRQGKHIKNVHPELCYFQRQTIAFLAIETEEELCRFLHIDQQKLYRLINYPAYRIFSIPKKKGGQRIILAPENELKYVQKRLNNFLQSVYLVRKPSCAHGFVPKNKADGYTSSIVSNARMHVGRQLLINMDLLDFFPSISAKRVKQTLMSPHIGFNEEVATRIALLCTYDKCLPIGAPTSPVLSNFVCMDLDRDLGNFTFEQNIYYSRYADDLTFSTNLEDLPAEVVSNLHLLIEKHGFMVNKKKFRVKSNARRQTVTGIVVNGKLNVDRRYIRKLRAILHDCKIRGIYEAAGKHQGKQKFPDDNMYYYFPNRIRGQIEFVGMVKGKSDPVYLKLLKEFTSQCLSNEFNKNS